MKKQTLLLLALACTTIAAHAQFGLEAGLNKANLSIKSNGTKIATKYKAGASFGIMADMALNDNHHLYFEPGAFFQNDGAKVGTNNDPFVLNCLTFPLNIEYKSGEKCSERFFIGAGPYIRDNISGSSTLNFSGSGTTTTDLVIGTDIQRFDFGLGFNAGYLGKKHWYIRVNYEQGLSNNIPNGDSKNSIKQSTGGITLGYMVRGCRHRSWYESKGGSSNDHWRGLRKNRWSRHQIFHREKGPAMY
jgi:hypothetical protein